MSTSSRARIRHILWALRLDVTKNMRYDRMTQSILRKVLKSNSNCIDIGAHKGEMLGEILRYAPIGTHYAVEPIPEYASVLQKKFGDRCTIWSYALGKENSQAMFQFVTNAPAYSGLKKRDYAINDPLIREVQVEVRRLDELIPADQKIDFIKIDVEGGEYDVLRGASLLLQRCHPVVIFEYGRGAAEHYGSEPGDMFDLLNGAGYSIYSLRNYLNNGRAYDRPSFADVFAIGTEYYFVGAPNQTTR